MFEVLQSQKQIVEARNLMVKKKRSAIEGRFANFLRRWKLHNRLPIGDMVKSWDVARTLEFIEANLPRDAKILDLGSYCSELPVSLARMKFTGVHGVDLNPRVVDMPHSDRINYTVSDFMDMPFPSSSFDAVTSISVIEHGYNPEKLFSELERVLKPGGYFIASFDYWPEKIETGTARFFDMSWLIFSKEDVHAMIEVAKRYTLNLMGAFHPDASERAIHCQNFSYTFGWIVFRKDL